MTVSNDALSNRDKRSAKGSNKRKILIGCIAALLLLSIIIIGNPGWFIPDDNSNDNNNNNLPGQATDTKNDDDGNNTSDLGAANDLNKESSNPDSDGDGISDVNDNCPMIANPRQMDRDGDGIGNACDPISGNRNGGSTIIAGQDKSGGQIISGNGNGGSPISSTTIVYGGGGGGGGGGGSSGGGSTPSSPSAPKTNHVPVANSQSVTTDEDTPVIITLTGTDEDGDSLVFSIISMAKNGTLSAIDASKIMYSPQANYYGNDSFQYLFSDGISNSTTALVNISVNSINDPPIFAGEDNSISVTVDEDNSVIIDVLPHITDPDGDTVGLVGLTPPSHGTAVINEDGSVTFTPNPNYNGQESFEVTVSDGNAGGSTTITLIVTVSPVPDAPAITGNLDNVLVNEDSSVDISLLGNAYDPDGDAIFLANVTQPIHGTVSIDVENGIVTYTPNANYNGTDTFDFTIADVTGLEVSGSVHIQAVEVNDAPVTTSASTNTNEETPVQVTFNATDADNDPLTFTIISHPTHGTVSISGDNEATYTPNTDYFGADSFSFQANDGLADSNVSSVTINVINVNDTPVANTDYMAFHGWDPVTIVVLANDIDADGDPLNVTNTGAPAHGSIVINSDNTVTYTAENGFIGLDNFVYFISDGNGGMASATVNLGVNIENEVPFTTSASTNTNEETPVQVTFNATDADNDPLTFTIISHPTHGTVSISGDNEATYTPNTDYFGADSFSFQANDGLADSNVSSVTINVINVNDTPKASNDMFATHEDTPLSANTITNDVDVDEDALSILSFADPVHGTVSMSNNGAFTYTPDHNFYGVDSFQYIASDGNGGTAIATVIISVTSVDDAPTSNNDAAHTTLSNPVWINVLSNDFDVDEDPLHVTSIGPLQHGTASIVNNGSAIVYTPNDDFAGDDEFTYTVSDGTLTSTGTVFVHVYPFKFGHIQSPVGDGNHEFQQGNTANVRFKLTDQNGEEVINAVVILQMQQVDSSGVPVGPLLNATSSGESNDGNYFKYSASAKLYQYNLKTDTMAVGKWALYAYLIDFSTQPSTYILLENAPIDGISTTILVK